jgi:hypothetical protein
MLMLRILEHIMITGILFVVQCKAVPMLRITEHIMITGARPWPMIRTTEHIMKTDIQC